ncbi:MAG: hypothetical protein ACRBB2_05495 [Nitrosopumilus sp.]
MAGLLFILQRNSTKKQTQLWDQNRQRAVLQLSRDIKVLEFLLDAIKYSPFRDHIIEHIDDT